MSRWKRTVTEKPGEDESGTPIASSKPSPDLRSTRPVREFHIRRADRVGDAVFRGLARLGVGPASLLTTRGRRTGRVRSTPVIPVRQGDQRWLVAPYGDVSWVLNARAAGQVGLRHGRQVRTYAIREVAPAEAGPILKQYVAVASATRPYFRAEKAAPVREFVAEANLHPVFQLTPLAPMSNEFQKNKGSRRLK